MHPIVAEFSVLGLSFTLTSYGLCASLGFIFALVAIRCLAPLTGLAPVDGLLAALFALVSGIVGAKGLFILVSLPDVGFSQVGSLLSGGGFVFYGGFFAGCVALVLYARRTKLSLWAFTDAIAPALALGHGFGRIGCFLMGCCFGVPTTLPIGVIYPASPYFFGPTETPLHPVQLYEAAVEFILAAVLAWALNAKSSERMASSGVQTAPQAFVPDGKITFAWATCYGLARLCLELFFRGDDRGVGTEFFPPSAWASVLLLGASVVFWVKSHQRTLHQVNVVAAPRNDPNNVIKSDNF